VSEHIYGRNSVKELLENPSRRVDRLYYSNTAESGDLEPILNQAYERGIPVEATKPSRLDQWTDGNRHQGIVAVASSSGLVSLDELLSELPDRDRRRLMILDQIQDPVNVGKLIRSGQYFGVNGVVKSKDRSAPISNTVVKTSAGAANRMPIAEVTNLKRAVDKIKKRHFWLVGADLEGTSRPEDVPGQRDLAVVLGNEESGIRRLIKESCDYLVRIPGPGSFDSLNVAMAGTVLSYELQRESSPNSES